MTNSEKLPLEHVAIIMDGNRRWAEKKKLPKLIGHKEGVKSLKRLVKHVSPLGLKYLTVYAFSSENWQRDKEEVDYLFNLFAQVLKEELSELAKNNVVLKFIGNTEEVPPSLQKDLSKAEESTKQNSGLHLQIALNYGSHNEITKAAAQIAQEVAAQKLNLSDITPELMSSYLYTKGIPDPDLIIRTGGEVRLSNFLLWQAAYSELYITQTMWPDFAASDFDQAITEYTARKRRYGG